MPPILLESVNQTQLSHQIEIIGLPPVGHNLTFTDPFDLELLDFYSLSCGRNTKEITQMGACQFHPHCHFACPNHQILNLIMQVWKSLPHGSHDGFEPGRPGKRVRQTGTVVQIIRGHNLIQDLQMPLVPDLLKVTMDEVFSRIGDGDACCVLLRYGLHALYDRSTVRGQEDTSLSWDTESQSDHIRRMALGSFLKTRRQSLTPEQVSLPRTGRRRTPGLRREEVAELAQISTAWYTCLEQGRDVQASRATLERLASALRLNPTEKQHLLQLGSEAPAGSQLSGQVPAVLLDTLKHLDPSPAFITDPLMNLLAWNQGAIAIFTDFGLLEKPKCNLLHYVLTDQRIREMYQGWESNARRLLAQFRLQSGALRDTPDGQRLLQDLHRHSEHFRMWWPLQDVHEKSSGTKVLQHPRAGEMHFQYTSLGCDDDPALSLFLHVPLNARTQRKLQDLVSSDGG